MKLPVVSGGDAVRAFRKAGYEFDEQRDGAGCTAKLVLREFTSDVDLRVEQVRHGKLERSAFETSSRRLQNAQLLAKVWHGCIGLHYFLLAKPDIATHSQALEIVLYSIVFIIDVLARLGLFIMTDKNPRGGPGGSI
jgi:hypothetical protein